MESERLYDLLLRFNVILLELNKFNFTSVIRKVGFITFRFNLKYLLTFFLLEVKDYDFIYNATDSVYNTLQFQKVKDREFMDSLC